MSEVTLGLFSASRLNGEPYGCDLVFYVEPSDQSGDISRTECWGGKSISALRDRLMIEWYFNTCLGATKELENMVSRIVDVIKKAAALYESENQVECKTNPCYVRIGVVCRNGAHLSVCFVERLYDYFSSSRPYQQRLTVERDHWDAMNGKWGKNREFVWQQSIIPVRHPIAVRDLVKESMWQSLPPHSSFELEEAFRRNPFESGVAIGDEVFNFREGSMYNKGKKKTYRIRCTVLAGASDKISCRFLKHAQYISLTNRYRGAGILFYSVHPGTGEAIFLLGHITYCYSDWCDFGGLKNRMEAPRYTAARECYEETLGILGRTQHLVECLENYMTNNAFKVVNENTQYVSHFLRVAYKDYPAQFQQAVTRHKRVVEVDDMRWFPLSSLRKGVQYVLQNHYNILVEPINKDGCIDSTTRLPLRIEFAQTLCIADELGILDSIEHIARELHKGQASVQAQPYVSLPGPRTREGLQPKQQNESSIKEQQSQKVATSADTRLPHPNSTAESDDSEKEMDSLSKLLEGAAITGASDSKVHVDPSQVIASNSLSSKHSARDSGKDIVMAPSIEVSSQPRRRDGKSDRLKSEVSTSQKKKGGPILYFGMGAGFFKGDASCYNI